MAHIWAAQMCNNQKAEYSFSESKSLNLTVSSNYYLFSEWSWLYTHITLQAIFSFFLSDPEVARGLLHFWSVIFLLQLLFFRQVNFAFELFILLFAGSTNEILASNCICSLTLLFSSLKLKFSLRSLLWYSSH